jgi:hypothetical protein
MPRLSVGGQSSDSLAATGAGSYKPPMTDVAYQSRIRIERVKGPIRRAFLPAEQQPIIFGVHGAVAKHYKVAPDAYEPRATTLDYLIASAAG